MNIPLLYKDKPIFALDLGFSTVKVMQIEDMGAASAAVAGYGIASFDPSAVNNGVIVKPEIIAKATKELFEHSLIGTISTRRVALTVPAARVFSRTMKLPKLDKKDIDAAVRSEAEQYIPMPVDDLYIDYEITADNGKELELLVVAAPKKLVDSYVALCDVMGLELCSLETTISAASRLVKNTEPGDTPTILIDFGSVSADITIIDKTIIVTGTVAGGGDNFTDLIAQKLGVSRQVAHTIKTKYGLDKSKKQAEIIETLKPSLDRLVKEIRKMVRYYDDRENSQSKIGQVITLGGGANMPGLSDYITDQLRLPTRMASPWRAIKFHDLQPPNAVERSMYVTVAGLAMLEPGEEMQ